MLLVPEILLKTASSCCASEISKSLMDRKTGKGLSELKVVKIIVVGIIRIRKTGESSFKLLLFAAFRLSQNRDKLSEFQPKSD